MIFRRSRRRRLSGNRVISKIFKEGAFAPFFCTLGRRRLRGMKSKITNIGSKNQSKGVLLGCSIQLRLVELLIDN